MIHSKANRVLIVDTRVVYRQGIRALLERFPEVAVVGDASNGNEAISQARHLHPDVVLMDIHAPGYNVLSVLGTIRSELPRVNILLLALGSDDTALALKAIRAGARGFVLQDTAIENLVGAVCLVAQGQVVIASQFVDQLVDLNNFEPVSNSDIRVDRLTSRERQILKLIARGISNREIAQQLYVAESTVRTHMHNILDKLDVDNRVQAVALVYQQQRVSLESAS